MKVKKKLYLMTLLSIAILTVIFALPGGIYADNIEAKLPSNDGTDAFQVQDSDGLSLMDVLSNGNVGIGTTSPSVALDVIGDIEYTGTITDVSDERLKENIQPIYRALEKIQGINGVSYNMIDTPEQKEIGVINDDSEKSKGSEREIRKIIILSMAKRSRGRLVEPVIISPEEPSSLESLNEGLRNEDLDKLEEIENKVVVDSLREMLQDQDAELRLMIVEEIATIGGVNSTRKCNT